MARTVNEEEYAARREAILEAAYRLVVRKGYQQMTIQDVLVELARSRSAGALRGFADGDELAADLHDQAGRTRDRARLVVIAYESGLVTPRRR